MKIGKIFQPIDEESLNESIKSLISLAMKTFKKLNFLDIGCGSGLSSLTQSNLTVKNYAIDQDKESIRTTKKTLEINSKRLR